jgi:DNA mismatch repair protein MutL
MIFIDIRDAGNNLFQISAVPVDLKEIDLASFMHGILGYINEYRKIKLADLLKDKLASAACKAAVKGGMDLTQDEIEALFELMDGDMGLKCPHGRPVVVRISKKELEKKFKRIV